MSSFKSIVDSIFDSSKNIDFNDKIYEALNKCRLKTDEGINQWREEMYALLESHCLNDDISQLRMIILGSIDYTSSVRIFEYAPPEIQKFIEQINSSLNLTNARKNVQYDYSCNLSKQHTLFLNVGLSDDPENWLNVIWSIKFVNDVLIKAQKLNFKVAILDMRNEAHIHLDDLFPSNNYSNSHDEKSAQTHQENVLCKLIPMQKKYHHFVSKSITRNSTEFEIELKNLQNFGFQIDQLYMFNDNERSDYQKNISKCRNTFLEFTSERLAEKREQRTSLILRVLLCYAAKMHWKIRQIKFENNMFLINAIGLRLSKIDGNLFIEENRNFFILMSPSKKENSALIFSDDPNKIKNFVSKHITMIEAFGFADKFDEIAIQYDKDKSCFYLNQAKTIEKLIEKFSINTATTRNAINKVTSIEGNIEIINLNDFKDHNKTSMLRHLNNLKFISQNTRPEICASVSILQDAVPQSISKYFDETSFKTTSLRKPIKQILSITNNTGSNYQDNNITPKAVLEIFNDLEDIARKTRPDILTVSKLQNYKSNSNSWKFAIDIAHYLNSTKDFSLAIKPFVPKNEFVNRLTMSSIKTQNGVQNHNSKIDKKRNNDKIKNINNKFDKVSTKSQTGFLIRCISFPIAWISELARVDSSSYKDTTEIELIGAANAAAEMFFVKQLLNELGIDEMGLIKLSVDDQVVANKLKLISRTIHQPGLPHLTKKVNKRKKTTYEKFKPYDKYAQTLFYLFENGDIFIPPTDVSNKSSQDDTDMLMIAPKDNNFVKKSFNINFPSKQIDSLIKKKEPIIVYHEWIIENFLFLFEKSKTPSLSVIYSDSFPVCSNELRFSLRMLPKFVDNNSTNQKPYVSLYLYLEHCQLENYSANIKFQLSIIDANGQRCHSYSDDMIFKPENSFGCDKFVELKLLLNSETQNCFLSSNNQLTILARVELNTENKSKEKEEENHVINLIKSQNRFNCKVLVDRVTYPWRISEFSFKCYGKNAISPLQSELFQSHRFNNQYHLKLWQNGIDETCKEYVSLYLFIESSYKKELYLQHRLSIVDWQGNIFPNGEGRGKLSLDAKNLDTNFVACRGSSKFISLKDLFNYGNGYLLGDSLTTFCEIELFEDIEEDLLKPKSNSSTCSNSNQADNKIAMIIIEDVMKEIEESSFGHEPNSMTRNYNLTISNLSKLQLSDSPAILYDVESHTTVEKSFFK